MRYHESTPSCTHTQTHTPSLHLRSSNTSNNNSNSGIRSGEAEGKSVAALVARFDKDGELKSVARVRAAHVVREGKVTDARLTVSGGRCRAAGHGGGGVTEVCVVSGI